MNREKSREKPICIKEHWPKALCLLALIWALLSSMGWSNESINGIETNASQPMVSAEKVTPSQAPENQQTQSQPQMTQDFLMDHSPLSQASSDNEPKVASPEVLIVPVSKAGRECSSLGDGSNGSQTCLIKDEDGSFTETTAAWENFGDEEKMQTISKHYNANGDSAGEYTTRIKTNYRAGKNNKTQKENEYYDIVNQPPQGLITRDMIVKEFDSKGELKKMTWAHYVEIGTRKAGLSHHAVLYYKEGKLTEGYANQYKNGKVVDTLLNYNPSKNPNLRMEMTGITKWVGWIDHLIHQSSAAKI